MRVNVYAEEMTEHMEIVEKEVDGIVFTGLRFYLHLPTTLPNGGEIKGPFIHREGDDDSSAVTFWGKRDMRGLMAKGLDMLNKHYNERGMVRKDGTPIGSLAGDPAEPFPAFGTVHK